MANAEQTLAYLERCDPINDKWRAYIASRAVEVQAWIDRLHGFASLKPGRVADAVTARANGLQSRLGVVLDFERGQ